MCRNRETSNTKHGIGPHIRVFEILLKLKARTPSSNQGNKIVMEGKHFKTCKIISLLNRYMKEESNHLTITGRALLDVAQIYFLNSLR